MKRGGLILAVLVAAASPARAFVRTTTADGGHDLMWPTCTVSHWVNQNCALRPAPNQLNPEVAAAGETVAGFTAACEAAIEASFQAWVAAGGRGCTGLQLPLAGTTASQTLGFDPNPDAGNLNLVIFEPQDCANVVPPSDPCLDEANACDSEYGCFSHGAETIALTTVTYDAADGTIVQADIEVNNSPPDQDGFDYSAEQPNDPLPGTHDIEDVVTHEVGHFIGLAHNCGYAGAPACTPTLEQGVMFANDTDAGEIVKRTLKQDDIDAVCTVYPAGSCDAGVAPAKSGCSCSGGGAPGCLPLLALALLALRRNHAALRTGSSWRSPARE